MTTSKINNDNYNTDDNNEDNNDFSTSSNNDNTPNISNIDFNIHSSKDYSCFTDTGRKKFCKVISQYSLNFAFQL